QTPLGGVAQYAWRRSVWRADQVDEEAWLDTWPAPPAGYQLPPLPTRNEEGADQEWADALTDPHVPALARVAGDMFATGVRPEWPLPPRHPCPVSPPEGLLTVLEQPRLSLGCGLAAAGLLLGAGLLAAVTSGFLPLGPFGNGDAVPTHGVQANPRPT